MFESKIFHGEQSAGAEVKHRWDIIFPGELGDLRKVGRAGESNDLKVGLMSEQDQTGAFLDR